MDVPADRNLSIVKDLAETLIVRLVTSFLPHGSCRKPADNNTLLTHCREEQILRDQTQTRMSHPVLGRTAPQQMRMMTERRCSMTQQTWHEATACRQAAAAACHCLPLRPSSLFLPFSPFSSFYFFLFPLSPGSELYIAAASSCLHWVVTALRMLFVLLLHGCPLKCCVEALPPWIMMLDVAARDPFKEAELIHGE